MSKAKNDKKPTEKAKKHKINPKKSIDKAIEYNKVIFGKKSPDEKKNESKKKNLNT